MFVEIDLGRAIKVVEKTVFESQNPSLLNTEREYRRFGLPNTC